MSRRIPLLTYLRTARPLSFPELLAKRLEEIGDAITPQLLQRLAAGYLPRPGLRVRPKPGRPRDSGTFESRADFLAALTQVLGVLRTEGIRPTQAAVAERLATDFHAGNALKGGDERQLRAWLRRYGVAWEDVRRR